MMEILVNNKEVDAGRSDPANLVGKLMSLEKFHDEILKLGDMIMQAKRKDTDKDSTISG